MNNISDFMTKDHRHCDEVFARAEQAVDKGEWETAAQQTKEYLDNMERHFTMEEQVLFPAFENETGITDGPTMIMKDEHQQMRQLFIQLQLALEEKNAEEYLGTSETLLIMMQQHNMKEEGMLYPMSDEQLADVVQIIVDMEQVQI